MKYLLSVLALFLTVASSSAQQLAVPIVKDCVGGQAACYATSQVAGLKATGDGFLAVRTGPGSNYRMIGKLRNGDVVSVIAFRGKWRGVELRNGTLGWVYSRWLRDLAG
ncbi:MAG: SH3 domain-containing protein [Pseudomonadota bacterium]